MGKPSFRGAMYCSLNTGTDHEFCSMWELLVAKAYLVHCTVLAVDCGERLRPFCHVQISTRSSAVWRSFLEKGEPVGTLVRESCCKRASFAGHRGNWVLRDFGPGLGGASISLPLPGWDNGTDTPAAGDKG